MTDSVEIDPKDVMIVVPLTAGPVNWNGGPVPSSEGIRIALTAVVALPESIGGGRGSQIPVVLAVNAEMAALIAATIMDEAHGAGPDVCGAFSRAFVTSREELSARRAAATAAAATAAHEDTITRTAAALVDEVESFLADQA